MEKTGNYQLSLWAPKDRILVEDFNTDNRRTDAALAALDQRLTTEKNALSSAIAQKADMSALTSAKNALQTEDARLDSVKLQYLSEAPLTVRAPASGSIATLDVSHIDFAKYLAFVIQMNMNGEAYLSFNSNGGRMATTYSGRTITSTFFPMRCPDAVVMCLSSLKGEFTGGTCTYDTLKTLVFTPAVNGAAAVTGTVRIYGF